MSTENLSKTTRTRFAPSPTGFMHVGNLRTGLFAWLTARNQGGQFVLRIEDTDKNREVAGSAEHILECLRMLGLEWDEGIEKGGPFEPYLQSDRLDIYQRWAKLLIEQGRAYADPYSSEQVQAFRKQARAEKRAFLLRNHRPKNPPTWDGSQPLRFKSDPKNYRWHDEVMGDLSTGPEVIDDFILIKSDGYPTYNFAHIIDDMEMQISHVIRGQEFISSMPNYLNLYEALGFDMNSTNSVAGRTTLSTGLRVGRTKEPAVESSKTSAQTRESDDSVYGRGEDCLSAASSAAAPENEADEPRRAEAVFEDFNEGPKQLPVFAHMPHIMNEQGNKKLGKRDGAKDVLDYVADGFLPETLLAFIATLGWNDGTEQEIFSQQELIDKFSLQRVQRSGARFDDKRLLWMNGQFIRQLSVDDLMERVENFWPDSAKESDDARKKQVLVLVQDRLKTLSDLPVISDYFFAEPQPNWDMVQSSKQFKKADPSQLASMLEAAAAEFEKIDFSQTDIQNCLNQLLESTGQKPGILFSIIRLAVSWAPFSPPLPETLAMLGKETTLTRLRRAIDAAPSN